MKFDIQTFEKIDLWLIDNDGSFNLLIVLSDEKVIAYHCKLSTHRQSTMDTSKIYVCQSNIWTVYR